MAASGNNATLSVYIHWPFCASKCPYCDFNSHVTDSVDSDRWRSALLAELAHFAAETKGRAVTSVFFGGGTPSLMDPDTAAALIEAVKSHWRTDPGLEVTLEANPSTAQIATGAGRFRNFFEAGVNRLSSACSRSMTARLVSSGAAIRRTRPETRFAWRRKPSPGFHSI